jgi:2-succinyl-5-enolpyruvyl-6-hydroxy-3-cyclohexene-1-carboxylate synthase
MQTTELKHIAFLADYCAVNGIQDVIISPGSRNAPMIIAFESHPDIRTHLIHDERSAAFHALGMADANGKAVALVCTSGTALLNYAPAIAEAYYRQVPMLILSADRPEELIDQGDGQTIRQFDVFHNYIVSSHTLPNHNQVDILGATKKVLNNGFTYLNRLASGPVHINVPLAEPLYNLDEYERHALEPLIPEAKRNVGSIEDLQDIEEIWRTSEKKMLLIGQSIPKPNLQLIIDQLATDSSLAILVENTSNIHGFTKVCHNIDRTLAAISEEELAEFRPDLLISIGGAIISKRIKSFLRSAGVSNNWRVGHFLFEEDTYQSLTKSIGVEPAIFLQHLHTLDAEPKSSFGNLWKQKDFMAQQAHDQFLIEADYSDLKVFESILDFIPENSVLHMANSSVVRYCQLFNPISSIKYYANRGVSGIDGASSTAAGFSLIENEKLNTIISGDISFFYDSNAFWNRELKGNLKVIVINNGGGGIFQIIPGPKSTQQEKTFFAPTNASIKGVCDTYDLNFFTVSSLDELNASFEKFYAIEENDRPSVLEIVTNKSDNSAVLESYFKFIASENI